MTTSTILLCILAFAACFLLIGVITVLLHVISYMLRVIFSPIGILVMAIIGLLYLSSHH